MATYVYVGNGIPVPPPSEVSRSRFGKQTRRHCVQSPSTTAKMHRRNRASMALMECALQAALNQQRNRRLVMQAVLVGSH